MLLYSTMTMMVRYDCTLCHFLMMPCAAIIVNYINDTPEMDGQDMRVNLETAGCFETLTCSLQRGRQVNCEFNTG